MSFILSRDSNSTVCHPGSFASLEDKLREVSLLRSPDSSLHPVPLRMTLGLILDVMKGEVNIAKK